MDYSKLIQQAVKAISENHKVDDEICRLGSILTMVYIPDSVSIETVKNHPEIQFLLAKESAYDSGYDYAINVMQPMMEYLGSEQFSEDFSPSTDVYEDINSYFYDWLTDCIDNSKQYSPWEFRAQEINEFPDPDCVSDLWVLYDEGQQAAIDYWVKKQGLKSEADLLSVLDDMEDTAIGVEYRLTNGVWHGLPIEDVFEFKDITAPDFIPATYLENEMCWLSDLASHGAEGGNFLVYNSEIWEVAHKSDDLDSFLEENGWEPKGEDLTSVVVHSVWWAAQTWAMNVLSELELKY